MPDDYTHPELGRAVERIELDLREIKTDLKQQGQNFVSRGEFEAWRTAVDREVKDIKGSVDKVNAAVDKVHDSIDKAVAELKSARPTWWQVTPIVTSIIAVAVVVFPVLTSR